MQKKWTPMRVERVGSASDILRMPGAGKVSIVGGDMGDPKSPKGQG